MTVLASLYILSHPIPSCLPDRQLQPSHLRTARWRWKSEPGDASRRHSYPLADGALLPSHAARTTRCPWLMRWDTELGQNSLPRRMGMGWAAAGCLCRSFRTEGAFVCELPSRPLHNTLDTFSAQTFRSLFSYGMHEKGSMFFWFPLKPTKNNSLKKRHAPF